MGYCEIHYLWSFDAAYEEATNCSIEAWTESATNILMKPMEVLPMKIKYIAAAHWGRVWKYSKELKMHTRFPNKCNKN